MTGHPTETSLRSCVEPREQRKTCHPHALWIQYPRIWCSRCSMLENWNSWGWSGPESLSQIHRHLMPNPKLASEVTISAVPLWRMLKSVWRVRRTIAGGAILYCISENSSTIRIQHPVQLPTQINRHTLGWGSLGWALAVFLSTFPCLGDLSCPGQKNCRYQSWITGRTAEGRKGQAGAKPEWHH